MSGRFQLDPRAPAPERPLPPPPGPASAKPQPPTARPATPPPPPVPAPVARSPAAPARKTNRKVLVIGAVVVALLLVGGAVAVYVATALGYPDKYVLSRSEMPSGASNKRMSASELDDAGMRSNPGNIDWEESEIADAFSSLRIDEPEEAHGQMLSTSGPDVVVLALKYADEEQAKGVQADLRQLCTFAGGSSMRYGDVIVIVISEDDSRSSAVRTVANAVVDKAGKPDSSCGL